MHLPAAPPAPDADDRPEEPYLGADGAATLVLALLAAALTGGLSLVLAFWHVLRVARSAPNDGAEEGLIVVLGTRLRHGSPGCAFLLRLDRAASLSARLPGPVAVLGGGRPAEADAGLAYLLERGLPPARLLAERRSRHTLENLRELRARIAPGAVPMLLVTNRSHLARALLMAAGLGFCAQPRAAEPSGGMPAREWLRLPAEAFLLHWYVVGRGFARLTRNRRMLRRIA